LVDVAASDHNNEALAQYWVQLSPSHEHLDDAAIAASVGCTSVPHKLHGHTFHCLLFPREVRAASGNAAVAWVGPVVAEDKWDPSAMGRTASLGVGVVALLLPSVARVDVGALRRQWAHDLAPHYRVRRVGRWALEVRERGRPHAIAVPPALLRKLAGAPAVYWMSRWAPVRAHNLYAVPALLGDGTPVSVGDGGQGETIAIADTGLDTAHCAFDAAAAGGGPAPPQTTLVLEHGEVPPPPTGGAADGAKVLSYVRYRFPPDGSDDDDDDRLESTFGDMPAGHGTHVMASAVGAVDGAAPSATLVALDIGADDTGTGDALYLPHDIGTHMLEWLVRYTPAHIFSVSFGVDSNAYDEMARQIDEHVWHHDDFLVVVAAGNVGASGLHTVGSPATAKNVLAVGASCSPPASFTHWRTHANVWEPDGVFPFGDVSVAEEGAACAFSSRGPTADGRIAPQVLAPGSPIVSARAGSACGHVARHGTSMAAPLVAGIAARLRAALRAAAEDSAEGPSMMMTPSAALLRAILVSWTHAAPSIVSLISEPTGTARVLDGAPTVWHQGHGVLQWGNMATLRYRDRVEMDANGVAYWTVAQGDDDAPLPALTIVLAWTDPPAPPNARRALVLDADLDVLVDGHARLLGNGASTPDKRNNLEVVRIPGGTRNLVVAVRSAHAGMAIALAVAPDGLDGVDVTFMGTADVETTCVEGLTPPRPCFIPGGGGVRVCTASGAWAETCTPTYCVPDYVFHGGACVADDTLSCAAKCDIAHGEGRWCGGHTCVVSRCALGYHPNAFGSGCECMAGAGLCSHARHSLGDHDDKKVKKIRGGGWRPLAALLMLISLVCLAATPCTWPWHPHSSAASSETPLLDRPRVFPRMSPTSRFKVS